MDNKLVSFSNNLGENDIRMIKVCNRVGLLSEAACSYSIVPGLERFALGGLSSRAFIFRKRVAL